MKKMPAKSHRPRTSLLTSGAMMTFEMSDIDPSGAVKDWGANRRAMNPPRLPTIKTISPAAHSYNIKDTKKGHGKPDGQIDRWRMNAFTSWHCKSYVKTTMRRCASLLGRLSVPLTQK